MSIHDILNRIYKEEPKWWPHGLRRSMLDKAWIVQDPATNKPAGFTGWQFRDGEKGKQAFYAVGILPEFRRQGLARKALKQMFEKHTPADVAEIKAFVVPDNKPSMGLAQDLGVTVQHKSSGLLSLQPACNLTKMSRSKYIPNSYGGVSLQQFMPIASRRTQLTPQESQAVEDGSSQWLPRIFTSMADSPADDMHSPGKGALMAGLAGLAAGAGGAHLVGADQKWQAGAGAGAGLVGALLAYNAIKAKNEGIQEMMRRIPPNGTRRDMLADPVLQADLERASRTGSSEEALRTAQLLAVLQATKQASDTSIVGRWLAAGARDDAIVANKLKYLEKLDPKFKFRNQGNMLLSPDLFAKQQDLAYDDALNVIKQHQANTYGSRMGTMALLTGLIGSAIGGVRGLRDSGLQGALIGSSMGLGTGAGVGALLGAGGKALDDYRASKVTKEDVRRMKERQHGNSRARVLLPFGDLMDAYQAGEKRAGFWSGVGKVLRNPNVTPALTTGLYDSLMLRPEAGQNYWDAWRNNNTGDRARMALMNYGLLRGGSLAARGLTNATRAGMNMAPLEKSMAQAVENAALIPGVGGLVFKDVGANNMHTGSNLVHAVERMADAQSKTTGAPNGAPAPAPNVTINSPSSLDQIGKFIADKPLAAAGIGAAGVGLTAAGVLGLREALRTLQHKTENEEQGRIKVTLPTRRPGDAETSIDIPARQIELSDALFGRIRRDVRNRLQAETKERTRKLNLSPEERARRAAVLASYR